jgi:hypothetical protein
VLSFSGDFVEPIRNVDELTKCSTIALKRGYFNGLIIVDTNGRAIKIKRANKLHGVGSFWVFSILLNQTVRVTFEFAGGEFLMSLDEVKARLMNSFQTEAGQWDSRDDFDDVVAFVQNADSIKKISDFITMEYYRKYT